ncbi:MAG TPA: copper resistance protein B [Steroidobacteraceae bacterium]
MHGDHTHHPPGEPTPSERAHVPPDPPQLLLDDLSHERMMELMQMDDDEAYFMVRAKQFEWRQDEKRDAFAWDAYAWYGKDYDKLWIETEGVRSAGETAGRVELLWDRVISRWWSLQTGMRHDFSTGPSRTWAAFGVQGIAPYFFEVEATIYVSDEGRMAVRLASDYDLRLTQRLILQPEVKVQWFGEDDPENRIGSGLSTTELGLRLRYELRREFAPYVGVHWERAFGDTADFARAAQREVSEWSAVAGMRVWF